MARHFSEPDGTLWEVVWQAPVAGTTRAIHGTYRFRALDTGESYSIAAGSSGGDRLRQMMPADVQQLLALARSGLLDD